MRPNFAIFSPTFSLADFLIFALSKILEKDSVFSLSITEGV